MTLKDKVVVVTGGGSGIGLAVAKSLAAQGCRVVVGGRREEVLQAAVASCDVDPAIRYHKLDVADRKSVSAFFAWTTKEVGSVDILVNSAGGNIADRTMSAMKPEEWDHVLRINATGAYNCMHAVLGRDAGKERRPHREHQFCRRKAGDRARRRRLQRIKIRNDGVRD